MRRNCTSSIETLETRKLLSADLAVAFAGAFPTEVSPIHSTRVAVRVTNTGDVPVHGAQVSLLASTDTQASAGDSLLTGVTISKTLNPGKTVTVKLPFSSPDSLADGNYQILARVAGADGVADANPANDVAVGPTAVPFEKPFVDVGVVISGQPQGEVSTVGNNGRAPAPVTVGVDLYNAGNVAARGSVGVDVYLSADGKLDDASIAVVTALPRSIHLNSAQVSHLQYKFQVPANVPAGAYTLIAKITPADAMHDRSLANNIVAGPQQLMVVNTPIAKPSFHRDRPHYSFGPTAPVITYGGAVEVDQPSAPPPADDQSAPTPSPQPCPAPPDDSGDPAPVEDNSGGDDGSNIGDNGSDTGDVSDTGGDFNSPPDNGSDAGSGSDSGGVADSGNTGGDSQDDGSNNVDTGGSDDGSSGDTSSGDTSSDSGSVDTGDWDPSSFDVGDFSNW